MKNPLFVESPLNPTMCFHSIHSTKIQRNIENLVEIHSTKFSKGFSLNENVGDKQTETRKIACPRASVPTCSAPVVDGWGGTLASPPD